MSQLSDHLFEILGDRRFLDMAGLANNDPIFIQTYNVEDEDRMTAIIHSLTSRLRNAGIQAIEVNLFDLLLDELREEDILDDLIADEATFERQDLFATLRNHADPTSRLVPRLVAAMESAHARITLVSGVGHVFPFLRAHTLLDSIEPAMLRHPVVLFFPGEYKQVTGLGSQLRLFGSLPSKGYYRAFNLEHYRLPSA